MRTVVVMVAICAVLVALFGVTSAIDVPALSEERPDLGDAGLFAALASVALLVVDIVMPVPSSGVMLVNGALFGLVIGAALSLTGTVAATCAAWWIGRRGERVFERFVGEAEREAATRRLGRRGAVTIAITRPLPLLAETIAVMAGATGMPFRRLLLGAVTGSLAPAIGYAVAGATATGTGAEPYVLAGGLALSAGLFLVDRALSRTRPSAPLEAIRGSQAGHGATAAPDAA